MCVCVCVCVCVRVCVRACVREIERNILCHMDNLVAVYSHLSSHCFKRLQYDVTALLVAVDNKATTILYEHKHGQANTQTHTMNKRAVYVSTSDRTLAAHEEVVDFFRWSSTPINLVPVYSKPWTCCS